MDPTCHRCGQEIETGTPFCRHCGAPQIRVALPESDTAAPLAQETPDAPEPESTTGTAAPPVYRRPQAIRWSDAFPSALAAGVILFAGILPYVGYFVWIVVAGMVAVVLYRRRVPDAQLTPANGARLGAVCGLFGFVGFAAIMATGLLLMRGSTKFREMLQQAVQQAAANNPDPKVTEIMTSPAGLAMLVTVAMLFFLVGFVILGSVGGAIGAWIFQPREKPPQM